MFKEFFAKIDDFGMHHQLLFAMIVACSIICISWGIEKILEQHLFPSKRLQDYLLAIIGGLLVLWLVQHYILHAL